MASFGQTTEEPMVSNAANNGDDGHLQDMNTFLSIMRTRLPNELYYEIAERLVNSSNYDQEIPDSPEKGFVIRGIPMCENARYNRRENVYEKDLANCDCSHCVDRRSDPIRTFIRTARNFDSVIWRLATKMFKRNMNFVYYPDFEDPIFTATNLDDFFNAFGANQQGVLQNNGIGHLTIGLKWKPAFGDDVPSQTLLDRGMNAQIFRVVRILSILQHYKVNATLVFPDTPVSLKPFLLHLYNLRKATNPVFENGRSWSWWRNQGNSSSGDQTHEIICNNDEAHRLYVNGYRNEYHRHQAYFKKWRETVGPFEEGDEPFVKIGHLALKVNFCDQS